MVNGPPCAACGWTLRWIPEQNGWGCDQCRQFFPAAPQAAHPHSSSLPQQPPQQPQQQYGQPQPPYGAPPSPYAPQGHAPSPYAPQPGGPPPGPQGSPYAPQPGGPQQPYSPYAHAQQMPGPPQPARLGGTSKLPLILGAAGVVVAGAVVAIVLVMRGGKGGASSRDEVITQAFAALTDGDAGKLNKLGSIRTIFDNVVDCSEDKKKDKDDDSLKDKDKDDDDMDMRHPEKMYDMFDKQTARFAEATKGTTFEIDEIVTGPMPVLDDSDDSKDSDKSKAKDKEKDKDSKDDDDDSDRKRKKRKRHDEDNNDTFVMDKGDKMGDGCKTKVTWQMQNVEVKLKVTEPGHDTEKMKVRVSVAQVGSRYYLQSPPNVKLAGASLTMAGFMRDDMCACSDKKCIKRTEKMAKDFSPKSELKDKMTSSEKDKLKDIEKEYKSCRKKAGGKGDDMEDALKKMTEFADQVCKCKEGDSDCAKKVTDNMTKWSEEMAKNASTDSAATDPEEAKKFADVSKRMSDCMVKAMTPPAAPPPPPPPPQNTITLKDPPAGMAPECIDFRDQLQKIASCDKMPATSKDALSQSWDTIVQNWSAAAASPSSAKAMADACKSAADSMKQSAAALCP